MGSADWSGPPARSTNRDPQLRVQKQMPSQRGTTALSGRLAE